MSNTSNNVVRFPSQQIAAPELETLIAEGMTQSEITEFVALANADTMTLARRIAQDKEPEAARRFTYRLWLVRRVLAQIDWSKAVIRNDSRDIDDDDYTTEKFRSKSKRNAEPWSEGAPPPGDETKTDEAAVLKNYPITWDGDITGEPAVPELVRGMLPAVGLAFLSGQWGMFKTFIAIDLAFSVMTMTTFATRATLRQGGVLLIAAEGAKYINLRLQGVKQAKTPESMTIGDTPFAWVKSCPPLVEDDAFDILLALAENVSSKLRERFDLPLALIILDTVASAANFRDANDGSENQRVMNKLTKLAEVTQTLVLAVDHFGKDVSTGTRNSSNKEGSADAILALIGVREIGGVISDMRMTIRKNRDGDVGEEFHFCKRLVELKEGGGSIVIDWVEPTPEGIGATKAQVGWPKTLHTLKGALGETLLSCGLMADPMPGMPSVRVVKREIVRTEYMRRYPGERSGAKTAFSAHCKAAVAAGLMQSRQIALPDGSLEDVFWALAPC
jgi:hypothetical protein